MTYVCVITMQKELLIFLFFSFSSKATLKHVAKTVAHVDLSDHVIDVVFTIFDENR